MESFYFDDSLVENEMHYQLSQDSGTNELLGCDDKIDIKADDNLSYNKLLDDITVFTSDNVIIEAEPHGLTEISIEPDIRKKYRKFDEANLVTDRINID